MRKWQDLLVLLHFKRRRTWHWPWIDKRFYTFTKHEAFIKLYNELSKGGCQDFTETIIPTTDEDSDWCEGNHISYLKFQRKQLCIGGWFPLDSGFILGNAQCLCKRHE